MAREWEYLRFVRRGNGEWMVHPHEDQYGHLLESLNEEMSEEALASFLNGVGADGWELVAVARLPWEGMLLEGMHYFKRLKSE